MMLLRADPNNEVDLDAVVSRATSIDPRLVRQHRVRCPTGSTSAYALCGSKGALDTVKQLTGLPINYLITVNFSGFIQIVDRVGGVWVDVDRRYYNKNVGTAATNFSNIDLRPGYQRLKGRDALSYVRYRHTDSDLFRLARQQQFVKALKQQVSSNFSVFKIAEDRRRDHAQRRDRAGRRRLAREGDHALRVLRVRPAVGALLPVEDRRHSGDERAVRVAGGDRRRRAGLPDARRRGAAATRRRSHSAARPPGSKTLPPSRISISVLNGNGVTGSASNAAYELGQRGYQIVISPNAADRNAPNFNYFHTMVYYDQRQPVLEARGTKVADLFGDAELERLPAPFAPEAQGAMRDRRRRLDVPRDARAGAGRQDAEEGACRTSAPIPAQTKSLLRSVRKKVELPADGAVRSSSGLRTSTARCRSASTPSKKGERGSPPDVPGEQRARRLLGHRGDLVGRRARARSSRTSSTGSRGASTTSTTTARTCTWSC